MIQLKSNLQVAERVRKAINRINDNSELMRRGWFECFDNCREQGYVLKISPPHYPRTLNIAFSESRNSDSIVVYFYTKTEYPSNLPTQDQWSDVKYFDAGAYSKAARAILARAETFFECGI